MDFKPIYAMDDSLAHHGILGQKWGVRRYQNEDGSLTAEGKKRYGKGLLKKRERAEDKRDVHRGLEKTAKRLAKPSGVAGGALTSGSVLLGLGADTVTTVSNLGFGTTVASVTPAVLGPALSVPLATAAGVGAGTIIYGSYKGVQAYNKLVADHKQKKIDEIDKMLK